MIDPCKVFEETTGFEDIEQYRGRTQDAATIIIAVTILIAQLLMLLLFFPIPQLPQLMQRCDVEFNFEEILDRKKKKKVTSASDASEEIKLLENVTEQKVREKRASGGLATVIVIVVVIVISTTSFVITSEEPGSVSYKSNKLASNEYSINGQYETAFGLKLQRMDASKLVFKIIGVDSYQQIQTCFIGTTLIDISKLKDTIHRTRSRTQIIATICGKSDSYQMKLSSYAPVMPPLSNYPPPGILQDGPAEVIIRRSLGSKVPVVSYSWNWIEMISSSALDLLAAVTSSRHFQAKITAQPIWTREVNSSYETHDGYNDRPVSIPWPECNSSNQILTPLVSFVVDYEPTSANNESYVVSEMSLMSWAFTTLITLGSVVALKPTIAHYLQKFNNYWTMKQWLRWLLFSIYTVIVPLPFIYVLFNSLASPDRLNIRGYSHQYYFTLAVVLLTLATVLMATWLGVLVRHINTAVNECKRKRRADTINEDIILAEDNSKADYEPIM